MARLERNESNFLASVILDQVAHCGTAFLLCVTNNFYFWHFDIRLSFDISVFFCCYPFRSSTFSATWYVSRTAFIIYFYFCCFFVIFYPNCVIILPRNTIKITILYCVFLIGFLSESFINENQFWARIYCFFLLSFSISGFFVVILLRGFLKCFSGLCTLLFLKIYANFTSSISYRILPYLCFFKTTEGRYALSDQTLIRAFFL